MNADKLGDYDETFIKELGTKDRTVVGRHGKLINSLSSKQ